MPGRATPPSFNKSVNDYALSLSSQFGDALLVRWDDREGFRSSEVYRDGELMHRFSNDDELYVLLDEDGYPLIDGKKYKETELDSFDEDEEFEVFQNALELGCNQAQFCNWKDLHEFIKRQG